MIFSKKLLNIRKKCFYQAVNLSRNIQVASIDY